MTCSCFGFFQKIWTIISLLFVIGPIFGITLLIDLSFCNSGKLFLGLPYANVYLSIVPINLRWSDTPVSCVRVFIKRIFLLVRKLSTYVGLILLKQVGSDIRAESSWSLINSLKFGLSRIILKSLISKMSSWDIIMSWLIKCQDNFNFWCKCNITLYVPIISTLVFESSNSKARISKSWYIG